MTGYDRLGVLQALMELRTKSPLPFGERASRPLKNYLRWQYGVKNRLGMLIYSSKLRFLACFCLVLPASPTLFNGLLVVSGCRLQTVITNQLAQ